MVKLDKISNFFRNMLRILYLILLGLGLIIGYVKYIENIGIFFPDKEIEFYPSSIGLHFEDIYIKAADGIRLNGWFIPHDNANYTFLFFHGNAGNIGHRLEKLRIFWDIGVNIFIIDYRNYGKSQKARLTEHGLYLDAKAAYNYLVNAHGIKPEQVILYGESLGTAVAVDLASKTKVKALIIEGGFTSGRDMARKIYPMLPTFIFSNKFDSLTKIKQIEAPKLFIHSRDDQIVPLDLARKLYKAAGEPKEFAEITGDHNNAFLDSKEKYISSISLFIEKLK